MLKPKRISPALQGDSCPGRDRRTTGVKPPQYDDLGDDPEINASLQRYCDAVIQDYWDESYAKACLILDRLERTPAGVRAKATAAETNFLVGGGGFNGGLDLLSTDNRKHIGRFAELRERAFRALDMGLLDNYNWTVKMLRKHRASARPAQPTRKAATSQERTRID